MGDRPAARHRAPRSRRRSVGMLCAVLLVPAAALTAVYLTSSTGATPTGLARGGPSQAGLPLYSLSSGVDRSAGAHNARMAAGCGLSHQCPGEPPLGTRETDAGVTWASAGETIGEGGPVAGTTAAIAQMALGLTQDMLNEKPPDDGHRLNILSSSFHIIGIALYRDSSGTVGMTQAFGS